jgi:flagellin
LDIFKDSVCDQIAEIPYDPLMTDLINKSGATAYELDTSLPNLGGIFANIGGNASSKFVDVNLDLVAGYIAQNGATQSEMNTAIDRTKTNSLNLTSAKSRILDVDVAQESSQLARTKVLLEAGTAMLAQANQSTQSILRLLQLN